MRDIVSEFGGLNLSEEDELSVLATTIAVVASTHHARHKAVYLDAVKTWALEVAAELKPPPVRLSGKPSDGPVDEGVDILVSGLDALIEAMTNAGVCIQDRLVTELALIARLLGQHDANTIHITLMAVNRAMIEASYRPGDSIAVPLREAMRPLSREVRLEVLAPRGFA
jgi:hypothetical protein